MKIIKKNELTEHIPGKTLFRESNCHCGELLEGIWDATMHHGTHLWVPGLQQGQRNFAENSIFFMLLKIPPFSKLRKKLVFNKYSQNHDYIVPQRLMWVWKLSPFKATLTMLYSHGTGLRMNITPWFVKHTQSSEFNIQMLNPTLYLAVYHE